MKLRSLVGASAGEIRDYSPIAARGALATGMAERLNGESRVRVRAAVAVMERPVIEKSKAPLSRKKG